MSDYGITPDEIDTLAENARETIGGLFCSKSIRNDTRGLCHDFQKAI
jgi:hypothetical protein